MADDMRNPPKLPPHSTEAEMSTLGGMMLNNAAIDEVRELVAPEDFYTLGNQLICAAIYELADRRSRPDLLTVSAHLKDLGKLEEVGGFATLATLANDTPSAANVIAYADIVRERALLRRMISAGQRIADIGFRPEGRLASDLAEEAAQLVVDIQRNDPDSGMQDIGADMDAWMTELERRVQAREGGMRTPWEALTDAISGLEDGDLVLVGGRPGTGKTTFALQIAQHITSTYGPGAGFSLEMPKKQWQDRLVSAIGGVDGFMLRQPHRMVQDDWDKVAYATGVVRKLPFAVDDRPATLAQLRSRCRNLQRRLKAKGQRLRVVVVDFLQKAADNGSKHSGRAEQVKVVSDGLKKLGKELRCPIIAISQNNRDQEKGPSVRRPRMSDLAEGNIESDADIVFMLYRDELVNDKSPDKGIAEVIICKQRSGPLKTVELAFDGACSRYSDYHGPDRDSRRANVEAPEKKTAGLGKNKKLSSAGDYARASGGE